MSLFDTYTVDKTALVLEIGAKYTKYGCAGEFNPRKIIPTVIKCPSTGKLKSIFSHKNEKELKLMLIDFIHSIYFQHVFMSPKDRQVVIIESLLCPTQFKHVLAQVLFCHFEVGTVLFVPSHLMAVCALGLQTALVVDVGYLEAQVIPVCDLVPVLSAWQAQPIAAQAVEAKLKKSLKDAVNNIVNQSGTEAPSYLPNIDDLSDADIEDIKVRGCFVTTVERGRLLALGENLPAPHPPPLDYRIKGDHLLPIPGHVREAAFEPVFERDNDNLSLPNLILDSILKCGIDVRRELAENVLLVGGTVMATGFKSRLMQELRELLSSPLYCQRLPLSTIKFHSPPSPDNCVSWLGGSLIGATEFVGLHGLTKDKFMSLQVVPDWSNLAYNQIYLSKLTI